MGESFSNVTRVSTRSGKGVVKLKPSEIAQRRADMDYAARLAASTQTHVLGAKSVSSDRPQRSKPNPASKVVISSLDGSIIKVQKPYGGRELAKLIKSRDPISRTLRTKIIHRDKGLCRYCGCEPYEIEIDHVVPVALGGPTTYGNLVTACRPCNQRKSARRWKPKPIGYRGRRISERGR